MCSKSHGKAHTAVIEWSVARVANFLGHAEGQRSFPFLFSLVKNNFKPTPNQNRFQASKLVVPHTFIERFRHH
jgi:hypothetical protein